MLSSNPPRTTSKRYSGPNPRLSPSSLTSSTWTMTSKICCNRSKTKKAELISGTARIRGRNLAPRHNSIRTRLKKILLRPLNSVLLTGFRLLIFVVSFPETFFLRTLVTVLKDLSEPQNKRISCMEEVSTIHATTNFILPPTHNLDKKRNERCVVCVWCVGPSRIWRNQRSSLFCSDPPSRWLRQIIGSPAYR